MSDKLTKLSYNHSSVELFKFIVAQLLWILWVPLSHELTSSTNNEKPSLFYMHASKLINYMPTKDL